jgi:hypothetical protein
MTIEMTSDEIINLFLGLNVEVLEFVHGCEFLDVETVGEDSICGLARSTREVDVVKRAVHEEVYQGVDMGMDCVQAE